MLGIFLYLFNLLGKVMGVLGSTVDLNGWPSALGIAKHGYWAQFDGNQTRKLLENVNVLRNMLKRDRKIFENEFVKIILMAMENFNEVRKSCFGLYLDPSYTTHIKDFGYNYLCLVNMLKDVDTVTFNVTLKVHILFCHVKKFLDRQNEAKAEADDNWIPKGLGFW